MTLKKILIKNSFLNVATYLYLLVASFFSIPMLLNSLGKEIFGAYIIIGGLVTLISTMDLGLGQAVIRFLSIPNLNIEKRHRYWQTSFFLFIVIGTLMAVICTLTLIAFFVSLPALNAITNFAFINILLILIPYILLTFLSWHFLTIVQSEQRFDIYSLRSFIVGTGNTLVSAGVASIFPSIAIIFLTQLFFIVISLLIIIKFSGNHFKHQNYPKIHPNITKKLLGFGIKNFIGRISNQFSAQFSNYILGGFSAVTVTAFSIPKSIVLKAAGGVSQLTLAIFPLSASLLTKDRIIKLKYLVLGIEVLIFTGGLLALVLVQYYGEPFLLWWLKDADIASLAFPVLKVLTWFFFLTSLTPIPSVVLDSMNYPQIPSIFAVITTILETTLVLILTPRYEILGPAYATVISSAIMAPLFLVVFAFILQKEIKRIQFSNDVVSPTMPV